MVASEIPNTWWLTDKSCLHMLAFMVHRKNVEFSNLVTVGNAPLTREMQRIRNVEDTVRERQHVRQIVSAQAMASPSQVRKREIEDNLVQAAIEKNQVKSAHMKTMTIQTKLDAYEKHKDTIIRMNGEEHYHKTIDKLMKEMIGQDDDNNE